MPVRPPLRLLRLGNPVVRAILLSPAHGLLSGRLIVVEYEGHRTGRTFAIPLRYAQAADGRLVAVAVDPGRKQWWRSFTEPRSAVVLQRGQRHEVVGTLAEGGARDEARQAYVAQYSRSARLVDDAAFVVFERSR